MISNQRKTNEPPKFIQKQSSGQLPPSHLPNDQYLLNFRKKTKRIRDRKATYSLCSVQSKPSLSPVDHSSRFRRRKMQSIASLDARNIATQRPTQDIHYLQIKQNYPIRHIKRTKTIDHCKDFSDDPPDSFCCSPRQKKIKDCIKIMKGVLDDIQNNQIEQQTLPPRRAAVQKMHQQGTLDYYIKSHAKAQNGKALLLRKGKSNSIIHVLSKAPAHLHHQSKIYPQNPLQNLFNKKVTPEKQQGQAKTLRFKEADECSQKMKSIQCSPIRNVNQSSFMSGAGKQSLIRQLTEQEQLVLSKQAEKGRRTLKLSNKKIKQVFPDGFFDKRI